VGGLSTAEIAKSLLAPESTIGHRPTNQPGKAEHQDIARAVSLVQSEVIACVNSTREGATQARGIYVGRWRQAVRSPGHRADEV
jgi:hypothetical protein